MRENCRYVVCPRNHKVYLIWSPKKRRFAFTCDKCHAHSETALTDHGVIEVKILSRSDVDKALHKQGRINEEIRP